MMKKCIPSLTFLDYKPVNEYLDIQKLTNQSALFAMLKHKYIIIWKFSCVILKLDDSKQTRKG